MSNFEDRLAELTTRLKHLEKYEAAFKREISAISLEIDSLKSESAAKISRDEKAPPIETNEPAPFTKRQSEPEVKPPIYQSVNSEEQTEEPEEIPISISPIDSISDQFQTNLEKFIGENLISKVGILVLIIGVAIGAKYAIDNNLISPLMRILFGYAVGFGLIGTAVKLKSKYHDYSAVLMSGGMAIMYFITYFAYGYYDLLSQTSAFSLMVIFTIFTVLTALIYDRQIIAHIGLVGAYSVPFLLSENSGRADILFTYIAIINVGILAVSVKKYWKPLLFNSFIVTWFIYSGWYFGQYNIATQFELAFAFLFVFFAIFYLAFLSYKVFKQEPFQIENIVLILSNSFLFFAFGYFLLSDSIWSEFLGIFTIINAVIHFIVGAVIYRFKLAEKTVFYLITALTLTFVSIAIPVQFDGSWLTVLLIAEALFLFLIGRIKSIPLFEFFSYPIMGFASLSLLSEWANAASKRLEDIADVLVPFINSDFLTTGFVAVCLGVVLYINHKDQHKSALEENVHELFSYALPAVFLVVVYNLFRVEIGNYFLHKEITTMIPAAADDYFSYGRKNDSLQLFNFIWQINYTMLFLTVLSFVNIRSLKNAALGFVNLTLNTIAVAVFITISLMILTHLGDLYLNPAENSPFKPTVYNILIRYISFGFLGGLFFASYLYIKQEFLSKYVSAKYLLIAFDVSFYFTLLIILSSELINWSDIFGVKEIYKLGLTILFAIYAVLLIVLGIVQTKKHLRMSAIALFAVTLAKLFLYDTAELGTISKTVVFVSVGVLLLVASFLYTKYRHKIFDDEMI